MNFVLAALLFSSVPMTQAGLFSNKNSYNTQIWSIQGKVTAVCSIMILYMAAMFFYWRTKKRRPFRKPPQNAAVELQDQNNRREEFINIEEKPVPQTQPEPSRV